MKKYEEVLDPSKRQVPHIYAFCNHERVTKINVFLDNREHFFYSTPCFSAFKFSTNVCQDECTMYKMLFERKSADNRSTRSKGPASTPTLLSRRVNSRVSEWTYPSCVSR